MQQQVYVDIKTLRRACNDHNSSGALARIESVIHGQDSTIRDLQQQIETMKLHINIEHQKRHLDPMMWLKEKVEGLTKVVDESYRSKDPFPVMTTNLVFHVHSRDLIELAGLFGLKWTHPERKRPTPFFSK